MDQPISIRCPHHDARLKVRDDSLFGRTAKCPKCQQIIVASAAAAPAADSYEIGHDAPPLRTTPESSPLPRADNVGTKASGAKSSVTGGKKKPGKRSKSESDGGVQPWVIGAGAAALLVFVIGAGFAASFLGRSTADTSKPTTSGPNGGAGVDSTWPPALPPAVLRVNDRDVALPLTEITLRLETSP